MLTSIQLGQKNDFTVTYCTNDNLFYLCVPTKATFGLLYVVGLSKRKAFGCFHFLSLTRFSKPLQGFGAKESCATDLAKSGKIWRFKKRNFSQNLTLFAPPSSPAICTAYSCSSGEDVSCPPLEGVNWGRLFFLHGSVPLII